MLTEWFDSYLKKPFFFISFHAAEISQTTFLWCPYFSLLIWNILSPYLSLDFPTYFLEKYFKILTSSICNLLLTTFNYHIFIKRLRTIIGILLFDPKFEHSSAPPSSIIQNNRATFVTLQNKIVGRLQSGATLLPSFQSIIWISSMKLNLYSNQ